MREHGVCGHVRLENAIFGPVGWNMQEHMGMPLKNADMREHEASGHQGNGGNTSIHRICESMRGVARRSDFILKRTGGLGSGGIGVVLGRVCESMRGPDSGREMLIRDSIIGVE